MCAVGDSELLSQATRGEGTLNTPIVWPLPSHHHPTLSSHLSGFGSTSGCTELPLIIKITALPAQHDHRHLLSHQPLQSCIDAMLQVAAHTFSLDRSL